MQFISPETNNELSTWTKDFALHFEFNEGRTSCICTSVACEGKGIFMTVALDSLLPRKMWAHVQNTHRCI